MPITVYKFPFVADPGLLRGLPGPCATYHSGPLQCKFWGGVMEDPQKIVDS